MQFRQQKSKPGMQLRHVISIPFIWGFLIPAILLDISAEIYHQICFRLYKIERIRRSDYIIIDRHHLSYLAWYEKLFCLYCGYVNGLFAYVTAIAGMTELYWCAIKHEKKKGRHEPNHHSQFVKYGDEKALQKKFPQDNG